MNYCIVPQTTITTTITITTTDSNAAVTALASSVANRGPNATVEYVGGAKREQCLSLIEDQKVNPEHYVRLVSWI